MAPKKGKNSLDEKQAAYIYIFFETLHVFTQLLLIFNLFHETVLAKSIFTLVKNLEIRVIYENLEIEEI